MSFKVLASKAAAALDKELMTSGGFTLDQLMELAGLSVAQAVYKSYPPTTHKNVVILSGPGNNGGDGLVAARHLKLLGYSPQVFYFIKSSKFEHLETQLHSFRIPLFNSVDEADPVSKVRSLVNGADSVVDSLFGFSFHPPLRPPYDDIIKLLNASGKPVISVDMPTGWDVDSGPNSEKIPAKDQVLSPSVLVSLTAPKPGSKHFNGQHYLGGRFISTSIAEKYRFDVPEYPDLDQVVLLNDSLHQNI